MRDMMPDSVRPPTASRPPSPAIYRWMIVVLGSVVALLMLYRVAEETPAPGAPTEALRKYWVVPPFALTERNGRTITNRDLNGKVWVADFVYTTCPGPCPMVTASMAGLGKKIVNDEHVQLVTFTVDPTIDTPAVLAKYADQYGADTNRWWFLTGSEKQIYDLISNGFKESVEDNRGKPFEPGQFTVTHSTQFALVDTEGTVRGYYDGTNAADHADILRDIRKLEKEAGL